MFDANTLGNAKVLVPTSELLDTLAGLGVGAAVGLFSGVVVNEFFVYKESYHDKILRGTTAIGAIVGAALMSGPSLKLAAILEGGLLGTFVSIFPGVVVGEMFGGDSDKIKVALFATCMVAGAVGGGVMGASFYESDSSKETVSHKQSVVTNGVDQKSIPCTNTPDGKWKICRTSEGNFVTSQILPKPAASPAAAAPAR